MSLIECLLNCAMPSYFSEPHGTVYGDVNLRDCFIYLDYIVIFSSMFQEHPEHLEAVFSCLDEHNLMLKASKC